MGEAHGARKAMLLEETERALGLCREVSEKITLLAACAVDDDNVRDPLTSAKIAERMIRERRRRNEALGNDLFAEPAWDMLLELYVQTAGGRYVSVTSLCQAAACPPTTALRYISVMCAEGKTVRRPDPLDRRRIFIELSPKMRDQLDAYFASLLPSSQRSP